MNMNMVVVNNGIAINKCNMGFRYKCIDKFVTNAFQKVTNNIVVITSVCKYILTSHIVVKLISLSNKLQLSTLLNFLKNFPKHCLCQVPLFILNGI